MAAILLPVAVSVLLFVVALGVASPQSAAPPAPDTGGMEPQVAALLTRLHDEVAARSASAGPWLEYGETLHAHGLVAEAAACYREATRLLPADDPGSLAARYLLAHAVRGSAPNAAATALEDALASHPGYAPAEVLLGEIHEELGDREAAAAAYGRALELAPESGLALLRLGALRLATGAPRDAIPLLEKALAAAPDAEAVRSTLAQAWNAAGERERASEVLGAGGDDGSPAGNGLPPIEDPIHFRMTERDRSSPALLVLAREAQEAGRLAEAESWYRDLAGIRSRDADVLAEFGAVLDQRGRPAEAEPLYHDAVALDPEQALARFGLGVLRAREGDLGGAEFQFRASLASLPDKAEAHAALGDVLLRQRRFGEALASLERAAELDTYDGAVRVLLAAALAELERYEEAWRAVHEAQSLGAEAPAPFLAALRTKHPEPVR